MRRAQEKARTHPAKMHHDPTGCLPIAEATALSGHPRSRILFTCQRSHTRLGGYLFSLPRISWSSAGRRHDMSSFALPLPPWWRRTGSNRRPHACKARALPTELRPRGRMVGLGRLELPTSRLSSARSNQLSYKPRPVPDARSPARSRLSSGPGDRRRDIREKRCGGGGAADPKIQARPGGFLRKEVIQPQVPLRLPCYDFTPVADLTVVGCLSLPS